MKNVEECRRINIFILYLKKIEFIFQRYLKYKFKSYYVKPIDYYNGYYSN